MGSAESTQIPQTAPTVISRSEHSISRANISENALKVLYRLKDAGFQAYLVGGGVRDLLLGREPKDFDVATDARPEQVRRLFRNCRLIGRRFRLAHVYFGREIVEVATFRAALEGESLDNAEALVKDGRILRDNVYGSIEQDALRRDFTVNALYYDIRDFSVVDYAGALHDLQAGTLRFIGDPDTRYREDPVRMLRAVRFAAKLGFKMDAQTEAPIFRLGQLLRDISRARLFDEVMKLFHGGYALECFELLRHYDLFKWLFPLTEAVLAKEVDGFPITFVAKALQNTDARINEGKPVTPAFLYAVLLWEPLRQYMDEYREQGSRELEALQLASQHVIAEQLQHTALPRRFNLQVREIWRLQPRFQHRRGKRSFQLSEHPRFRAAYDFMCLRAAAGEELQETCEWWTRFQEADPTEQRQMTATGTKRSRRRGPRRGRLPRQLSDP